MLFNVESGDRVRTLAYEMSAFYALWNCYSLGQFAEIYGWYLYSNIYFNQMTVYISYKIGSFWIMTKYKTKEGEYHTVHFLSSSFGQRICTWDF